MAVATAIIAASIAAGATVAGSAIASHGNTTAADTAAQASEQGTAAQANATAQALAFQKDELAKKQAALAPYQTLGSTALEHLGLSPSQAVATPPVSTAPPTVSVPAPAAGTSTQVQIPGYPNMAGGQTNSTQTASAAPATTSAPLTLQQLGSQQTQSSLGPAQSGEQRVINGQLARWDNTGWLSVQGAA